jgi:PilZ domain-containing protein
MAVSQDMIDALFEPETGPDGGSEAEREFSRVPFRGRASAVIYPPPSAPHAEPQESEVLTTDISRGGLSLLHRRELHTGQHVVLKLSRGDCKLEVCWCCRVWSGLYIAGCRFLDTTLTRPTS